MDCVSILSACLDFITHFKGPVRFEGVPLNASLLCVWFLSPQQLPLEGWYTKWEIRTKKDIPIDALRFLTIRWRLTLGWGLFKWPGFFFFFFLLDPRQGVRRRARSSWFAVFPSKRCVQSLPLQGLGSLHEKRWLSVDRQEKQTNREIKEESKHRSRFRRERGYAKARLLLLQRCYFRCRFSTKGWSSSCRSFTFGPGKGFGGAQDWSETQ